MSRHCALWPLQMEVAGIEPASGELKIAYLQV